VPHCSSSSPLSVNCDQLPLISSHGILWCRPGAAILDEKKRVLHLDCRPTDDLASSLFAAGLGARLGEEAVPSVALLDRHVRALDAELNRLFLSARTPEERRELSLAGLISGLPRVGHPRSCEDYLLLSIIGRGG
jgi:hypothetical protein